LDRQDQFNAIEKAPTPEKRRMVKNRFITKDSFAANLRLIVPLPG